jgi:hypothetical protein
MNQGLRAFFNKDHVVGVLETLHRSIVRCKCWKQNQYKKTIDIIFHKCSIYWFLHIRVDWMWLFLEWRAVWCFNLSYILVSVNPIWKSLEFDLGSPFLVGLRRFTNLNEWVKNFLKILILVLVYLNWDFCLIQKSWSEPEMHGNKN